MYTLTLFAILNYGMAETQLETFVDSVQHEGFLECVLEGERRIESFHATRKTPNNAIYMNCSKSEEERPSY